MNQEQKIEEGNRIIGIFDGWYQKDLPKNGDINWFHEKYSTKITNKVSAPTTPQYFKYHTSWDWLMPVVKKIMVELNRMLLKENLEVQKTQDWKRRDEICLFKERYGWAFQELSIQMAYKVTVNFIQFYNTTLPTGTGKG